MPTPALANLITQQKKFDLAAEASANAAEVRDTRALAAAMPRPPTTRA